ncbi:MAG: hypothetical protein VKO64_05660 [Candidatus Sericytochromatia bacterium]|nr:hypothetical protein [Candidatus Sericytochromatia bacterium]
MKNALGNDVTKCVLLAIALNVGPKGCEAAKTTTFVDPPVATQANRSPRTRSSKTIFDNAISELKPQVEDLLAQYPSTFETFNAVKLKRSWYGIRFYELANPYYKKFDNLSPTQKIISQKKFSELENYINDALNSVNRRLDEEHLKFKPWQRHRFEKLDRR